MKKAISLLFISLFSILLKVSALAQSYPTSSYTLSDNGETLIEWKGSEANIDLGADESLALVKTIGKGAFANNNTLKNFKLSFPDFG